MAPRKGGSPIKKHHAFHGVIMIFGWLLPPLAVVVRFGVGLDFFINIIMTICGYIPGHFHNFPQWIQNIRNNKNAKHSPKWAIKYGLVKDYRVKKTANGWSDRYGQGAEDFQNSDIIVDPITGETRRDLDARRNGNIRGGHSFPAPWSNNVDDSPRAEREDPYSRETRDPVTGAVIDDNLHNLSRTGSRQSMGSRYAERYGLGGGDNSSRESSSITHDGNSGGSRWGSSKKNKKDRWAREADVMGDPYRNQSYDSFDRPEEATRNTGNGGGRGGGRGMISDPMQDRHDF